MEIGCLGPLARSAKGTLPHAAAPVAPAAVEPPPEAPAVTGPEAGERWGGGRPGRAHVRQALHRLERLVREEIKAELAQAGPEDEAYAAAVRELEAGFATGLRDAFAEAGRGHAFDRAALLGGIATAVGELKTGLQELRESLLPEPAQVPEPTEGEGEAEAPAPQEVPLPAYDSDPGVPGGLVSLTA